MNDNFETQEILVNFGPQHPSTHGVLRVVAKTDGEIIREVYPKIGFLHRCFEKVAENLQYAQVIPYTDRLDYLSSMNNEIAYCLGVENLLNIELPKRASYIRVIVAELNRIASHLIAFGSYALDLGAYTPFLYAFREREYIISIFEKLSGNRLLYNYNKIGGVSRDFDDEIVKEIKEFVKIMSKAIKEYHTLVSENLIFIKRTANVGVISKEDAISYALTGPCLRGSSVKFDLRKNAPYLSYSDFDFDIPIGKGYKGTVGDSFDRYYVRLLEIEESLKIISQAINNLPEGDFKLKLSKILKPNKGECYIPCENPKGELGFYIVSDGTNKPYRVKARGASFCNLSILSHICKDILVADLITIIGSLDIVLGDVDR
ncbi:MAG: NADH-quinone oxidoreductase subunit D [Bdellovibrionota bacterium]|nr:NADH-quinone oxidoreductase subunit D [Pseudomonadota bacterium]MDY6090693.1 NADH-quinone oxidoreductase subunit D [Bdellovibrionota bacterium]